MSPLNVALTHFGRLFHEIPNLQADFQGALADEGTRNSPTCSPQKATKLMRTHVPAPRLANASRAAKDCKLGATLSWEGWT
jgi:hypothetical protein